MKYNSPPWEILLSLVFNTIAVETTEKESEKELSVTGEITFTLL